MATIRRRRLALAKIRRKAAPHLSRSFNSRSDAIFNRAIKELRSWRLRYVEFEADLPQVFAIIDQIAAAPTSHVREYPRLDSNI
jgi:hypothetical protein